jgi:PAS domain S-box-containing protein
LADVQQLNNRCFSKILERVHVSNEVSIMRLTNVRATLTKIGDRPWQWVFRPRHLRTLLAAMAVSLVVPALAFSVYLVLRSENQSRALTERRLVQVATALANDLDREFEQVLTLLDTLALSTRLNERDFAGFHARAEAAVKRLGASVIVLDAESQQLLNTHVPYGTPLPKLSDLTSAETVRTTKAPVVSNLILGAISRRLVFNVLVPLTQPSLSNHVLIISLDAEHLLKVMTGQSLQPGWMSGVSDRDGLVVARSRDHNAFVGKRLPPELLEASRSSSSSERSAFSTVNLEGVQTLRGVARSKQSGWLVTANVPLALVNAEIRRSQAALVLGTLVLMALAATLATLFARLINTPMRALASSAVTLEGNAIPELLNSPVAEANHVAAALRAASIELKSRTTLLRTSEQRLALAQQTAQLAYVDLDLAVNTVIVSDTFADVVGFQLPLDVPAASQMFLAHVHPDDRSRVSTKTRHSIGRSGFSEDKFRVVDASGEIRWVSTHSETFADVSGKPTRMLFTVLDVTHATQQADHINFLLREVSHRSKNLLAVIQAMATQTGRTSPDYSAFQTRFSQRLQGMAASHDLLVNQDWRGVDVGALVRAQVRPFADEHGGRLELAGPNLLLKPEAAQSLGLALHELATNATKYGALSVPQGKVDVSWQTMQSDAASRFRLTWQETGGPHVMTPARKGFGHTVFDRMIKQALNASIDLQYPQAGVVWSLETALDKVATI